MDHQLLFAEMTREHRKWAFSTKVYGTLYPAIRFYLIVASGLVAAKEPLTTTPLGELAQWMPVLAVSVPIVTALDTWLKPRDKWRGFMRDRDELGELMIRASGAEPEGAAALESLNAGLAELRRRHRDENVF